MQIASPKKAEDKPKETLRHVLGNFRGRSYRRVIQCGSLCVMFGDRTTMIFDQELKPSFIRLALPFRPRRSPLLHELGTFFGLGDSQMTPPALFAIVVAVASIGQPELTPKQCQERLAGVWEAHLTPQLSVHMEIEGDDIKLFQILNNRKTHAWSGKLKISAAVPMHHFDWKQRVSPNGPLADNQCLYRLVGDTLLLIGGGPNKRPTKFLSGHGNEPKTMVFTRVPTDR